MRVPIKVQCFDSGSLHIISTVYVQIEDVNEPPSDIVASDRVIEVEENLPAGTGLHKFLPQYFCIFIIIIIIFFFWYLFKLVVFEENIGNL